MLSFAPVAVVSVPAEHLIYEASRMALFHDSVRVEFSVSRPVSNCRSKKALVDRSRISRHGQEKPIPVCKCSQRVCLFSGHLSLWFERNTKRKSTILGCLNSKNQKTHLYQYHDPFCFTSPKHLTRPFVCRLFRVSFSWWLGLVVSRFEALLLVGQREGSPTNQTTSWGESWLLLGNMFHFCLLWFSG